LKRRLVLYAAAALAAAAVLLAVSGGFRTTVGGLRISMRSPLPIAILSVILFAIWYVTARREASVARDLDCAWAGLNRHSTFVAATALAAVVMTGVFATSSAAGADASGYISEAWMLGSGRLFQADELADVRRGNDPYLTSPLGWRPSGEDRQAPTYPPGLPALMAIPHAIAGVTGASALVILSAGIAIFATGRLAFLLGGNIAAVIAAAFIAFTPVFIYQSIQPMSDVPVTAAWMLCFVMLGRGGSADLFAGLACGLAVLIRPNLAPLAIVPLFIARRRVRFAIPVAIAGVLLALLQSLWYGSPIRSGYGSADELFALSNVAPNASRYVRWLMGTAPALLLSVFGALRLRANRLAQGLFAFAVFVVASYLVYAVFDDWSYLRFLLPAMAIFAVFASIELSAWIDRWPVPIRPLLLFAIALGVTAHALWVARSMDTFKLADQLRRVSVVADFINEDVPPAAVIVAGEQSGSMRYYTERPILRWEAAAPDALAAAMTTLEQSRRPVYIVLDAWEDGLFRTKFAALPAGALDWPPILDAGTSHRTRLWKLSDRERFSRGEQLSTIRLP
jgi:hypothetical protein